MEMHDGFIWFRRIPIQRVTSLDIYRALRAFGVGESQAQAVAAKLITVRLEAK